MANACDDWTANMDRGLFDLDTVRNIDPVLVEAEIVKREHQADLRLRDVLERFRDVLTWRAGR